MVYRISVTFIFLVQMDCFVFKNFSKSLFLIEIDFNIPLVNQVFYLCLYILRETGFKGVCFCILLIIIS